MRHHTGDNTFNPAGSSEIMIGEEQKKQKHNLNRLPLIRISVSTLYPHTACLGFCRTGLC
jgi:hypothetical protein